MARRRCVYEGKEKDLYEGPSPGLLVQHFKDSAWVRRPRKVGVIDGKGVINNRISEYLMTRLTEIRVPTNFVRRLNMREQLVHEVEVLPVEVMVRNIAPASSRRSSRSRKARCCRVPSSSSTCVPMISPTRW